MRETEKRQDAGYKRKRSLTTCYISQFDLCWENKQKREKGTCAKTVRNAELHLTKVMKTNTHRDVSSYTGRTSSQIDMYTKTHTCIVSVDVL